MEIKFSLKGRATRSEWLLWKLVMVLLCLAISFTTETFGDIMNHKELSPAYKIVLLSFCITLLVISISILLINISFDVRRLHDMDFSGWWLLLNLMPLAYLGFFLYFSHKKRNIWSKQLWRRSITEKTM